MLVILFCKNYFSGPSTDNVQLPAHKLKELTEIDDDDMNKNGNNEIKLNDDEKEDDFKASNVTEESVMDHNGDREKETENLNRMISLKII